MIKSSPFRRLLLLGVLTEAAYIVFLVRPFALQRYYATPLMDLGKLTDYKPWQAAVAAMALVFLFYALACRTSGDPRLGRLVLAFAVLFALTQMLVYPIGALDIFDYIFFGREMTHYGANIYVVRPSEFANDVLFPYVGWKWLPFTYGPLWGLISRLLNGIGQANLLANLLLFKSVAIGAYLGTSVLIYRLLSNKAPDEALRGTIFFAWNPLVVFEVATNGHNDILVVLCVVAGIAAFAYGRGVAGMAALALSILTKFVTAPLALLWLAVGWRERPAWRARLALLAGGALAAGLLALLAYAPFLGDRSQWRTVLLAPVNRQELFTSSFPTLVVFAAEKRMEHQAAEKLVRNGALALLLLVTVAQAWRVKGGWREMARASCSVLLFYLLFLCLWFQPWYVMWVVPLAALLPRGRMATAVALFSLSAMIKYLVFDFFWYWMPVLAGTQHVETAAVVCIYSLPLAYLAVSAVRGKMVSRMRGISGIRSGT